MKILAPLLANLTQTSSNSNSFSSPHLPPRHVPAPAPPLHVPGHPGDQQPTSIYGNFLILSLHSQERPQRTFLNTDLHQGEPAGLTLAEK